MSFEIKLHIFLRKSIDVSEKRGISDFSTAYYLLHVGFLLGLFFDPGDGGDMFLQKRRFTFNGLHGVISPKIKLFKTTAARTSNPT
jgi:hypothetical protein